MINRTGFSGISGTVKTSVGAKEADPDFGFEELLAEKTSGRLEIGNTAFTEDITEHILKSIASMSEGSKSIWEIVLQLEKHVDPQLLEEIINMDFDDTAGLNSIAGLLARFWKKKELLDENGVVFSDLNVRNAFDNKAVSELTALLRKKENEFIAEVHESVTDV